MAAAAMLEKLFAEVFERRDRTVSKVKSQTQIVHRNLASKLLIKGLTPPTWLLSSSADDGFEGPNKKELHTQTNKEELITGLLLPRPRLRLPHFSGECSWYSKQGAYSSDVELRGDTRPETRIDWGHEKSGNVQSQHQFTAAGRQSSVVAATPQDHGVERIGDFCPDSDLSLTRVQRSRSRQKALELRSSSKTGSKSCLGKRSNASVCSSDAACAHANDHTGVLEFTMPSPGTVEEIFEERITENCRSAGIQRSGCRDVEEGEAEVPASTENSNAFVKSLTNVDSHGEEFVVADHQPDKNDSQALVRTDLPSHDHDTEGVQSSLPRVSDAFLHELDTNQASSLSLQADDCQLEAEQAGVASAEGKIQASLSLGHGKAAAEIKVPEIDALTASGKESGSEKAAMIEFTPAISGHETEEGSSAAHGVPLSNFKFSTDTKVFSSPKSTETQVAKSKCNSSFQAAKGASWPQLKRRKIQSELSRLPHYLNADLLSLTCVLDAELHQEVVRSERMSSPDLLEEKVEMSLGGITVMDSLILNEGQQSTSLVAAEARSSFVEGQEVVEDSSLLSGGQSDNLSHIVAKSVSTMPTDDSQYEAVQPSASSAEGKIQASLSLGDFEAVVDAGVPEVVPLTSCEREIGFQKASVVELTPSISGNETGKGSSAAQCPPAFHFNLSTDAKITRVPSEAEVQLAELETHSKFHSAMPSWPQHKRRKIQSELSRMSYNLDAGVSSLSCVSVAEVHQKGADSEKKPSPDLRDEKVEMSIEGSTVMGSLISNDGEQSNALVAGEARSSFVQEQDVNAVCSLVLSGEQSDNLSHFVDRSVSTMPRDRLASAQISGCKRKSLQEELNVNASIESPEMEFMDVVGSDDTIPMFEALIAENEMDSAYFSRGAVKFEEIHLSGSTIQRASILEQVCKYVTLSTPLSHIASEYESYTMPSIAHSLPEVLIEQDDLKNRLPLGDSSDPLAEADYLSIDGDQSNLLTGIYNSDDVALPSAPSRWDSRMPYFSPVRNSFEGISSKSGGSSNPGSSNTDLVCFPIEEDAESCDEYAEVNDTADTYQEKKCSKTGITPAARKPLRDITAAENINLDSDIEAEKSGCDSTTLETTVNKILDTSVKENGSYYTRSRQKNMGTDEQSYLVGASGMKKSTMKHKSRLKNQKLSEKPSIRSDGKNFSVKDKKFANIVSNVKSFIPLVQQKQAAAALKAANLARRETRLKVLEAAEAAKRLDEKKENERKQKKEALKLKRARLKEENLRQMELQKKLKEEERKKREAEVAARKRQREEEERKEKERKRRRTEDARRHQREPEAKIQAVPKEQNCKLPVEDKGSTTPMLGRDGHSNVESIREPSYEISPYQCSDDELDEEDENKPKKFIPTWGRKSSIAQALPAMQNMDPDVIFPLESFFSMDEESFSDDFELDRKDDDDESF
ncbi:hypothetical protein AKJ16_DCAP26755, partial [Drosera capensis]